MTRDGYQIHRPIHVKSKVSVPKHVVVTAERKEWGIFYGFVMNAAQNAQLLSDASCLSKQRLSPNSEAESSKARLIGRLRHSAALEAV